jgi:hypothetical protein
MTAEINLSVPMEITSEGEARGIIKYFIKNENRKSTEEAYPRDTFNHNVDLYEKLGRENGRSESVGSGLFPANAPQYGFVMGLFLNVGIRTKKDLVDNFGLLKDLNPDLLNLVTALRYIASVKINTQPPKV